MKYTIHGFSQKKALELKLNNDDLLLLRWLVDFSHTKKMKCELIKGIPYYWVNYQTICDDIPILSTNKQKVYRNFTKLTKLKVLVHKVVKVNGTYSYYGFGDVFESLISDDLEGGYIKNDEYRTSNPMKGVHQKRLNKDLSTKLNPSTKEKGTSLSNRTNFKERDYDFDLNSLYANVPKQ